MQFKSALLSRLVHALSMQTSSGNCIGGDEVQYLWISIYSFWILEIFYSTMNTSVLRKYRTSISDVCRVLWNKLYLMYFNLGAISFSTFSNEISWYCRAGHLQSWLLCGIATCLEALAEIVEHFHTCTTLYLISLIYFYDQKLMYECNFNICCILPFSELWKD